MKLSEDKIKRINEYKRQEKIKSIEEKADKAKRKAEILKDREWYNLNSLMGYSWATKFFLLGARETGKSYAVTEYFIKQFRRYGRPFYWLRLTKDQSDKLLRNNASMLIDPDLRRKYNLDLITRGNRVYHVESRYKPDKKGYRKIKKKVLIATVLDLSTFFSSKGNGYFDKDFLDNPDMYYNICLDEMNREKTERKSFDIVYAFYNQIENLIRSTMNRVRIICIGNLLDDDCSDLLAAMNFIPEKFGRFSLVKHKSKLLRLIKELDKPKNERDYNLINELKQYDYGQRAIVEFMDTNDAYELRRKNAVANQGIGNSSTLTNKYKIDKSLITKEKLTNPQAVIKFGKSEDDWFNLWGNGIITKYKTKKPVIAMKPYLDELYTPSIANQIITNFDLRVYKFKNYVDFKRFENAIRSMKPRGN